MTINRGSLLSFRVVLSFLAVSALTPLASAQSASPPSISLSSATAEVAVGKTARISFSVTDADRCVASGAWEGEYLAEKTKSGTVTSAPLTERINDFVLFCEGPGGQSSKTLTILALGKPEVTLTAEPDRTLPGGSVTLSWQSTDATSCSASGAPFSGVKETSGSETLSELTKGTKKFSLSCKGVGGTTKITTQVAVVPAPTLTFSARATQLPQTNTGTQLKWKATDATSCVSSGAWSGEQKTSGSYNTGSLEAASNEFGLTCTGPMGEVSESVTVEVVAAPVVTLELSAEVIEPGQNVTISWTATDAQSCKASGAPFAGDKNADGGEEVLEALTKGVKKFKLTCKGGGGTTVAEATLPVVPAPTLTFSARATQLAQENSGTQLKWKATDATTCIASGAWSGEQPPSGNYNTGTLTEPVNEYSLFCEGPNGDASADVTVEVVAAPIVTLELSAEVIEPGQNVTISWTATDAQSCKASGTPFSGDKNAEGGEEVLEALTKGVKKFKLTCKGGGGTTVAEVTLPVVPAPTLTFSARATQLAQENSGTQLKWKATDATTCIASGAWSGEQPPSGNYNTGTLTESLNEYGLLCEGPNGEVSDLVTVEVVAAPVVTLELSADVIEPGQNVTIYWSATDAQSCKASGTPFAGDKNAEGGEEVLEALTKGTKKFKLTCKGGGGTTVAEVTLPVVAAPTLTFSARATQLGPDNSGTQLKWKATDATACYASGAWSGEQKTSGTYNTEALTRETNDFELTCVGENGEVAETVTIEVVPKPYIEFELSTDRVEPSGSVEFIWASLYADSCESKGLPWVGKREVSGREVVSGFTQGDRSFELKCTGPGGFSTVTRTLAVYPAPKINSFKPALSEVSVGASTTLSWSTTDAKTCRAFGDWSGDQLANSPAAGIATPALTQGTNIFGLICEGPGGEATAETVVTVKGAPKVTLTASEALIAVGQSVTVSWESSEAVRCVAGGDWAGDKPLRGEEVLVPTSSGVYNYELRCESAQASFFDKKSVSVEVVQPQVAITPLTIAFDPRPIGSESNPRVLRVENTSRLPVSLGDPVFEGDLEDFIFADIESCGDTLAPLSTCTVKVSFRPNSGGKKTLRATVTTSGSATPIVLTFTGEGVAPKLVVETNRIDFGMLKVGESTPAQRVTLRNEGSASVRIDSVQVLGDATAFSLNSACTPTIEPSASCEITLAFSPKASGEQRARVSITSTGGDASIDLLGYGQISANREDAFLKLDPAGLRGVVATVAGSGPAAIEGDGGPAVKAGVSEVNGLTVAGNGDIYFSDGFYIRRVTRSTGVIDRVAGTGSQYFNGDGRAALETSVAPRAIAIGSQGDVYFLDRARIRRLDPQTGVISTFAGTGEFGYSGDNGQATAAQIQAADLIVDASGNLFFTDPLSAKIRRVDAATGVVTSLTLNGAPEGFYPTVLALGPTGLHVYDQANNRIFRIDPATFALSLVAGNGQRGMAGEGQAASLAQLGSIADMAFDTSGNLLLADVAVRVISAATGTISTIAASFNNLPDPDGRPTAITALPNNQALIGVTRGDGFQITSQILQLDIPNRTLALVAGRADLAGYAGDAGAASSAKLYAPTSVAIDAQGNLFIGDRLNGRVRRVDAVSGKIDSIVAPAASETPFGRGFPTFTAIGANGDIYYSEWRGHRIMRVSAADKSVSVFAGTGQAGFSGDGGPATSARLQTPWGLVFDDAGNLYVSTTGRIRRIAPDGVITTIAGCCDAVSAPVDPRDGGLAVDAYLNGGNSALAHFKGKLYLHDAANGSLESPTIREIDLTTGRIRRLAGNGQLGPSLTNGLALNSPLGQIFGLTVDSIGNVYFSDASTSRISRINPLTGEIRAVAGGRLGFEGDGGTAIDAALYSAQGITFDRRGNLYFADRANHRVRVILCAAPPVAGEASDCDPPSAQNPVRRALMQWNQLGVDQCEAIGSWSGPRNTRGAEWLPVSASGEFSYGLRCARTDGSVSLFETVLKDGVATSRSGKSAKLETNSLSFGAVGVDQTGSTRTLRVFNTGNSAITFESIRVIGAGSPSYSSTSTCVGPIVAGGSCQVQLSFTPKSAGEQIAQIEIASGQLKLWATLAGNGEVTAIREQSALKLAPTPARGLIATYAGSGPAAIEGDGGPALTAALANIAGIVADEDGNIFVADDYYIREIRADDGSIQRIAGNGQSTFDGDGRDARITAMAPGALIVGPQGEGYFTDGARIRRLDPETLIVTTVAGTGVGGNTGDGGAATSANIRPATLAIDPAGNLYFADPIDRVIRRIDMATRTISKVTIVNAPQNFTPGALAFGPGGLHVFDQTGYRVYRINVDGTLTSVVGTGGTQFVNSGNLPTSTSVVFVSDMKFDSRGALYYLDAGQTHLRGISNYGSSEPSAQRVDFHVAFNDFQGGLNAFALIGTTGFAVGSTRYDGSGFQISSQIHVIDRATRQIKLVAGRYERASFAGDGGPASLAKLFAPTGVALDRAGNLFIGDRVNGYVRRVDATTGVIDSVRTGSDNSLNQNPTLTAVAPNGDVYYSEWRGHRVMKIDWQSKSISVVAGNGQAGFSGDGGPAVSARIQSPWGLAFDDAGNLYISTAGRVRKVTPQGVISTIAGCCDLTSEPVPPRDGALAVNAYLNAGYASIVHHAGKLYLQDAATGNYVSPTIREIDLSTGFIRRIAGNGQFGPSNTSGLALNSPLGQILGLAVDAAGDVYFSETTSSRISRIDMRSGEIRPVAAGRLGFEGDGGSATRSAIYTPQAMAFDRRGNLYFADRGNHRVRVVLCVGAPVAGELSDCDPAAALGNNRRVLVQWNQSVAGQCEAVGAWSGSRTTSGAVWMPVSASGDQSFALRCSQSDGSVSLLESVLNGANVTEKSPRSLKLDNSSIFFGPMLIGQSAPTQPVRIRNTGTTPISITSVVVSGAASNSFSTAGQCNDIAAGATCDLIVTFSPKATGEQTAQLTITSGLLSLRATLTGNGDVAVDRNQTYLKVSPSAKAGVIATVAGSGPAAIEGDGGPALSAGIATIQGMVKDAEGNLYISDESYIRQIDTDGFIRPVAGNGQRFFDGDGRDALQTAIAADNLIIGADGAGYFADRTGGQRIRRLDTESGVITTYAGTGVAGYSGDGGPAAAAQIRVAAMVRDSTGNLFFSDPNGRVIRRIDASSRVITTLQLIGVPENFTPSVLAYGPGGLHVFDEASFRVYLVSQSGELIAVAGNGSLGRSGDGGPVVSAQLGSLAAITFGSDGAMYLADWYHRSVRKVANYVASDPAQRIVTTLTDLGPVGEPTAMLNEGANLLLSVNTGNGLQISSQVLRINATSGTWTVVAGRGDRAGFAGDGGAATRAKLNAPTGLAIDAASGDLIIGDRMNGRIRRVADATGQMGVSVQVGPTPDPNRPLGQRYPTFTAVAPNGDVYYSEWRGNRVMKIDAITRAVSVIAGTGQSGFSGDGGLATSAQLATPWGLVFDEQGNLYVSTIARIRKIAPNGIITTVVGCCDAPSQVVRIPDVARTSSIQLNGGNSALAYRNGKLYFFDSGADSIASIFEADLQQGTVRRIAGNGQFGRSLTFGKALDTAFGQVFGLAVDAAGDVFVSDSSNSAISRIRLSDGEFRQIAGGRLGFDGDGGSATRAAIFTPQAMTFDRRGNLYFADRANHRVRVVMCAGTPIAGEISDCDPASVSSVNRRVLVQWNQPGVTQCDAVGAWSGTRAGAGAEWLSLGSVDSQSYGLLCPGGDGSLALTETVINGSEIVEKPIARVRLNNTAVSFGSVRVGESSAAQKLTLTNTGAQALTLDPVVLSGEGASSFTQTTNCATTLAANSSCDITLTFRPQSSGDKRAEIVVGGGLLKLKATLTGSVDALQPPSGLVIDAVDVNFGSLRAGSVSVPRFVRVRNVGSTSTNVSVSVTGIESNEIAVNSGCSVTLAAGADCEISLVLQPISTGSKTGQLIVANASGEAAVALRGRVGQSENQFICRATPEQTEPAPRSSVLDVVVSGVANENHFMVQYTPVPDATDYKLELEWESGGLRYQFFTVSPSSLLAYCPRVTFEVTPSSDTQLSYLVRNADCKVQLNAPAVMGQTKASVRVTAAGRTATDSIVLGAVKPEAPIVTASAQNGVVALGWMPVPTAIDYVVYRYDGSTSTQVATTADTSLSLPSLALGTAYTYAVKARSGAGVSAFSAPVVMTPRASTATNISVDDIRINQAIEVAAGSATKLIAGKPGIVEVYLNVQGDEVGMPGIVRLQSLGLEPIEIFGPLLNTPASAGSGAACVATFDLRDDAERWFAAGARNVTAEVEVLGRPTEGPVATASRSFNFVEERPLYVKLIPVNSVRGNPSDAEIELAKTSIEKQLRAMYPNRNPTIVLAARYQFNGADAGNNFLGELLPAINLVRDAELSFRNCDRFYYALHKDNTSLGARTVGLAYVPSSVTASSCPPLSGVGVIEFPLTVDTTAHEIGHNHGRRHVSSLNETNDNCGAPSNADSNYPHPKGRIGVTGYDSAGHRSLSKNLFHDIMGYCNRNWISDYQYQALRSFQESLAVLPQAASARMIGGAGGILFNGSIDSYGVWKLSSRLSLGGTRSVDVAAARGFTAVAVLSDGAEQTLPLSIVDIDHIARRDFSIWLPSGVTASEILVRAADGVVVFRQDLASGRMVAAQSSTTSSYRIDGNVLEVLPWGSGDRLIIRIRDGEREFVGNDDGSGNLRFEFATGDSFEVIGTRFDRRIVIGPLTITGSAREIDSAVPDSSTETAGSSTTVSLNEFTGINTVGSAVRDPALSATGETETQTDVSAIEMSRVIHSITGGRYVLSRSTKAGPEGYGWVLGYRSSGGALLNQWGLQSTAGVFWRRADETSRSLGTSGWVAVCANQVWAVRDGYQLLAGRADLGLTDRSEREIPLDAGDTAKVVESVSCRTGGGVTVSGYLLSVSADSPALRAGPVDATRFEVDLDPGAGVAGERTAATEFDVAAYCASPVVPERQAFCAQAGAGLQ